MWDEFNFELKIVAKGKKRLASAVSMWFDGKEDKNEFYTHYGVFYDEQNVAHICLARGTTASKSKIKIHLHSPNERIVDLMHLPYFLNEETTVEFLWNWLKSLKPEDWGPEPDCDGSVKRECFRMEGAYTDHFNRVLVLNPCWAEYPK